MRDFNETCKSLQTRYAALCAQAEDPTLAADPETYASVGRELRQLAPLAEVMEVRDRATENLRQAEELLQSETDAGLRALAEEEAENARQRLKEAEQRILVLLLPRDPNDEKNVVVEIRAGAGGEEAALFAADLYRMYTMYADAAGFRVSRAGENETGLGGFREISFLVEGEGAYSRLKYESGVHRVQRVPQTESGGRIHTSTCTVAVLPEAEEVEIEIKEADIRMETIKSGGAGGQHVNKTESAVRLIHLPTGMVVECQDERSQYKNRDKAMKLLRTRLLDQKRTEQNDRIAADRKSQVGSGDRSERIRTYNFPQGRVTDHRIGLTLHNLPDFLNGNIQPMTEALAAADTAERLSHSGE